MDWFKGKFTGKPHIQLQNLWFPVDFPSNQSIDMNMYNVHVQKTVRPSHQACKRCDKIHVEYGLMMTATGRTVSAAVQIVPYGAVVAKVWCQRLRSLEFAMAMGKKKEKRDQQTRWKPWHVFFRKWSHTWWFKHQTWWTVWDWTIQNRCQNQLEIRNDGALTHYKNRFIHEKTRNFRAGIFMVFFWDSYNQLWPKLGLHNYLTIYNPYWGMVIPKNP